MKMPKLFIDPLGYPMYRPYSWKEYCHYLDLVCWDENERPLFPALDYLKTCVQSFILYEWIAATLYRWKRERCKHPNMTITGHGTPDTGYDGGECPDCGFSFFHRYY